MSRARMTFIGYHILAGSVVFTDIDAMLHDPQTYQDPFVFNPGRFIEALSNRPAEPDPRLMSFGFGRRRCPGINLADTSVFMACAIIVATLDVKKAIVNGEVVEPVHEKLPGILSHPAPFKVSIPVRSAKARQLIVAPDMIS